MPEKVYNLNDTRWGGTSPGRESLGGQEMRLRDLVYAASRRLFGYAEPCLKCEGPTHYENRGRDRSVWIVCTDHNHWSQRRV